MIAGICKKGDKNWFCNTNKYEIKQKEKHQTKFKTRSK